MSSSNSSEDGLELQCRQASSSTAYLVDASSLADSSQPPESGVGQPARRGGNGFEAPERDQKGFPGRGAQGGPGLWLACPWAVNWD